jgi:class 3 adenylate cyclase/ketosteroid isomerase-like protein
MDKNAREQVLETHDMFWQCYARRDLDGRFAVCAPDITFFGTGSHERAVNREQYRAMNEKGVEQYPAPFLIEFLWTEVRIWNGTALVEGESRWVIGKGPSALVMSNRHSTLLREEDGRWWVAHVHGSEADYRVKEGEYMTFGVVLERNAELEREVVQRTLDLRVERDRSDSLLLNILPKEIAEELKAKGHADARHFDQVTILFTDFKGFTEASEKLTPQELVEELNTCFKAFDKIITKRGIEKIKTIGDAYMCAGGLPDPKSSSPAGVVHAALDMQAFMKARKAERDAQGKPAFAMRVGIHTGPVVAGIVGVKKFQYDIWGDTVNTASRMESSGEVGQVNISEATYELVKNEPGLTFSPRGKVLAKGKGELEMYFVQNT